MTISNLDDLSNALMNNSSRVVIDKASLANAVAGQFHSLWRATGQPGQGAIPTAVATCDNTLAGSVNFTQQVAPATTYVGYLEAVCSVSASTLELHDRLMHMGGLVGNVATAQTVNLDVHANLASANLTARIGDSNFSDVQWWMEWYADTGATACTATVAVTYSDGSSGNLSNISLAATRRASFMQPLNSFVPAAKSGLYIRDVDSVTLSVTTGTAGNFGFTATRPRVSLGLPVLNMKWAADWAALPIGEVPNSSSLMLLVIAGTTSTGTVRGSGKLAHG